MAEENKTTNPLEINNNSNDSTQKSSPRSPYDDVTFETVDNFVNDQGFLDYLTTHEKKVVKVSELTNDLKNKISQIVQELLTLKDTVLEKETAILEKNTAIKNKVENLVKTGKISIDANEYKKSETSVLRYSFLLKSICAEIEKECSYLILHLKENHPQHTVLQKTDSDDFLEHIIKKINYAKRYIKTISRDLSVSYSRYFYGFDAQLKKLSMIESMIIKKA